jgi:bifunctional non-homologous end joining protein LigD
MAFQRKKPAAIGVKATFPGFIEPALASSIEKVPSGARWIHEIKFDGYRVQIHLANEAVKIFTRRGHDWTNRFKKIAADAWHIAAGSAIVDGEVVVPAENGTTDFSVLQNELKGKSNKIVMVAFDLLYLNGYDLRKLPLIERKTHLKKIIDGTDLQFSESFEVDGPDMFAHACKVGLEGVVSKVRDSRYASGRGNDWVKKTCAQRETLTIAGFALDGSKWDGIYVGRRKGTDLVYAGKVDHGFDRTSADELRKRLCHSSARRSPTPSALLTAASGSSRSYSRRSSTAPSPLREKCDIHSSKRSERIFDPMPFSRSTFTVEIDGVPTFVFQATRQIEAEEICSEWCAINLQHLIELNIIDARASTKVRIARSSERAEYENKVAGASSKETVPLVYLKNFKT